MAIIITDPDNITDNDDITITTAGRTIDIDPVGGSNMGAAEDGIAHQALYSKAKEDWKDDPLGKSLMAHPFPYIAITPEQFEWVKNWIPNDTITRKAIRTGGWKEIDSDNGDQIKAEYMCAVSLGDFVTPATDTAWYNTGNDPTITNSTIDFDFPGPVNESVLIYEENVVADAGTGCTFTDGGGGDDSIDRQDAGSWITDGYRVGAQVTVLNATTGANNGTFLITSVTTGSLGVPTGSLTADTADNTVTFARNYKNAIALFLRIRDGLTNGKTFGKSDLDAIGVTEVDNKVFRFPLSNATDLKVLETDANVSTISPYTEIRLRYLDSVYNREVDSATKRNFGIVVDVGTYSQSNADSATSTTFTSANWNAGVGEALGDYTGGTLIIHEGTDQGVHTIVGTPTAPGSVLTIVLSVALTDTEANLSFTMQRSSPVVATAEEIYEKVQYQLRQAADIDGTDGTVAGKTADEVLGFNGETLEAGKGIPVNPNGGGTGVIIEGFDSNDTNRLTFYDNAGSFWTFPFVAAGSIAFNINLQNDSGPAEYFMYFDYTIRTAVSDFVITNASGATGDIASAGNELPDLTAGDFVRVSGLLTTETDSNGIWEVTVETTPTSSWVGATKVDGQDPVNVASAAVNVDQNPIDSDDAILVKDNGGTDITGTIATPSVGFDFDYDGNVQGGRTPAEDAPIVIRAIGTDVAQYVETTGLIIRAVGLSYSLVAALERVYST